MVQLPSRAARQPPSSVFPSSTIVLSRPPLGAEQSIVLSDQPFSNSQGAKHVHQQHLSRPEQKSPHSPEPSTGTAASLADEAETGSTTALPRPPKVPEADVLQHWATAVEKHVPLCVAIKATGTSAEVVRLCEENWETLNIFHVTASLYKLGQLIGVRRSEIDHTKALGRPQRFQERQQLAKSELMQHLLLLVEKQGHRASRDMLCMMLWGLARLRIPTPDPADDNTLVAVKALAVELKKRILLSFPSSGSQFKLSMATWALSLLMRKDAPWADIFALVARAVQQSSQCSSGAASSFLKAAATYKVVHGDCPLPAKDLSFLAICLAGSDDLSIGPQAISQGLYALAKLRHHPGEVILSELCGLLPQRITSATIDRQAVANAMWAMGELDYCPSSLLMRQYMQLVMIHSSNFSIAHFSQVCRAFLAWKYLPEAHQMQNIAWGIIRAAPHVHDEPEIAKLGAFPEILEELYGMYQQQQKDSGALMPESIDLLNSILVSAERNRRESALHTAEN